MSDPADTYVGRFAPSPTGPMHFGSLLTAVASYAQAKSAGGRWLVRIEDIDPPRAEPGSDKLILNALEVCGFEWDGSTTYQSSFTAHHHRVVRKLLKNHQAYRCSCSRKDLAEIPAGTLGPIYPGICRNGCDANNFAIRIRTNNKIIEFKDVLQGTHKHRLESESGDFIIIRRDGLIAYNLAVVVDDYRQGITEIVRGIDLLTSTSRHIWLQKVLGFPTPSYMHIPVAVNNDRQKLSKLTGAIGIDCTTPGVILFEALRALGQKPPVELAKEKPVAIWPWALENWRTAPLTGQNEIQATIYGF